MTYNESSLVREPDDTSGRSHFSAVALCTFHILSDFLIKVEVKLPFKRNSKSIMVLHGPILVIVYDTEGVSIDMLAQMDTLESIVLADISSGVDRHDAGAFLLGSLGVPITVVSPKADIDATADALFTYIALLNQPVVAPRYKTMPESEATRDSQAVYLWRNCPTEASTGPSFTGPVTYSSRLPQTGVRKQPLWETAEKRQSLGERTLGLVGLGEDL
ncbi:unnamed protein product [Dibothriocephalus latus]|uniref:Uncharacterized protein n=1 Tax=Dibothriocephalus latus TaxID=60516 RepID=A0A3P7LDU7_DIBLA|nr:unnamed protein product [Dibothriocephalus latus]